MSKASRKEAGNWRVIHRLLPYGWEQQAKRLGAMRRVRALATAETLLRALLIHLAEGCSLKETSLRIRQAGWGNVSSVALFKRLQASEQWLRWIAREMWPGSAQGAEDRRLLAVDATTVKESGQSGALWRVHWSVNLRDLQCEQYQLTDAGGGESLRRYALRSGDIVLADAGHSSAAAVQDVISQGADVVIRVNYKSFPLFDAPGQAFMLRKQLARVKSGEPMEWTTAVPTPSGKWNHGRLIAMRRSPQALKRALRRLRDKARRRQRGVSRESRIMARYILLWTSLPAESFSTARVLSWYRLRWQIELVFKRMKSIMGLGQLPKRSDASARAWIHGKLLVATLVERLWREAEAFSPWGFPLESTAQPLA